MAVREAADAAIAERDLADIFGTADGSLDPRTRALTSRERFVRSHTGLARWSDRATGQVLTAYQAYDTFGWPILSQLIDKPVAPIIRRGAEAAQAVRRCREHAGVTVRQLAQRAAVAESDILAVEAGRRRMPMAVLAKVAQTLGLSPTRIGIADDGGGDPALGVRLRQLRTETTAFTPAVVLGLMEAAWVISEQSQLESWLDPTRAHIPTKLGFRPQPIRASIYPPAFEVGMTLAAQARTLLGYSPDEPIIGLLPKLEKELGIPVVQVDIPGPFVGATIENGSFRGIAVNMGGINANVWTRRMTVAHELGHHLWDPSDDLRQLRIDERDDIEGNSKALADPIEVRANAFAAEFLAPQAAVVHLYEQYGGGPEAVSRLMQQFGVSFTALKWQLHNGSEGRINQATLRSLVNTTPSDAWKVDEGQRTDYFPFPTTAFVRRGRFVDLCISAMDANLISAETVASYMGVEKGEFDARIDDVRDLISDGSPNADATSSWTM